MSKGLSDLQSAVVATEVAKRSGQYQREYVGHVQDLMLDLDKAIDEALLVINDPELHQQFVGLARTVGRAFNQTFPNHND